MTPFADLSFHLVDDPDSVASFVEWYTQQLNRGAAFAVDTETNGLTWWEPNHTRLVQFSDDRTGYAIPTEWHPRLIEWALTLVRQAGNDVVFHNAKFDMHSLEADGYTVPRWDQVHDTQILHHLHAPHKRHGLKPVASETFGSWAEDGEYFLKEAAKKRGVKWWDMPVDHPLYWGYGVVDTILTRRLFDKHGAHTATDAYEREMEYQRIMYEAETRGLTVDVGYSVKLKEAWARKQEQLCLSLQQAGIDNPGSNKQVEAALKDLGWQPEYFTETGQAQLDKIVLDELQARGGLMAEVAEQLVEYKRLVKWTSTYLDPFIASGGRVHASVRTMGAKTGRSSITGPPLQTLPSRGDMAHFIKRAVLPNTEGDHVWAIDYSGQEYRILAALSNDPAWMAEFQTGNGDPHQLVADMLGLERRTAKDFNFALVYGAGSKKLSVMTGLHVHKVEQFLQLYAQRFPGIVQFKNNIEVTASRMIRNGEEPSITTIGGRRAVANADSVYALTNYLIQGSGADVLKEATCRLDAAGYSEFIMVPVHDELIFSFPRLGGETLARECASIMTNTDWFSLPITTEVEGPFETWGHKYA